MDEAPVLGALPCPGDELGPELFAADHVALQPPAVVPCGDEDFHVFKDVYLSADPKEPLLRALHAPPGTDPLVKGELVGGGPDAPKALAEFPGLPELNPMEDSLLARAPPPAYNVHFLSSLLAPRRNPAVVPLGAWPREGAAHPGVRMIPVEVKEAGGPITSNNRVEDASFPSAYTQESCCKFTSAQDPEDPADCPQKDPNAMVICQLKGGTQMLCLDHSGTRELKALHLVPQYQDQNHYLQSDVPKPMTTLVGRFLPVPAKFNLLTQQLDKGPLPPAVNAPTLPGPPQLTLAGYNDCFASGDYCNNCNYNNCGSNLRHEIERFKAIKACLDRNPEVFQPKIGLGRLAEAKPWPNKGCNCKRSGCLKNYCDCYEAKIMCSSICKCIGCKNYEESPEHKTLMSLQNNMEIGGLEGSHPLSPCKFSGPPKSRKDRQPFTCISREVVETTCACLLAQGEEAEKEHCSQCLAEQRILEEFGRCLSQILHIEFKSKGLNME
ncbi:PREDICTED: tesmin [Chrysochloris asiatica]|uniref:Tesmin n=1 Tax=Chrysochloris asiatica TaxID=185453 RepID=A0A9B0TGF8_CHRAS|nr:PREDICTED: tesmin [Chrysochloris asiatica]